MGWDRCLLAHWPHHHTGCHWSSGHLAHAITSLCPRHTWLVRSGCCQQRHDIVHHSGAGVRSMLSSISGPHSGGESSAVHCQEVEIVYKDWRDVAAMCCLLHRNKNSDNQKIRKVSQNKKVDSCFWNGTRNCEVNLFHRPHKCGWTCGFWCETTCSMINLQFILRLSKKSSPLFSPTQQGRRVCALQAHAEPELERLQSYIQELDTKLCSCSYHAFITPIATWFRTINFYDKTRYQKPTIEESVDKIEHIETFKNHENFGNIFDNLQVCCLRSNYLGVATGMCRFLTTFYDPYDISASENNQRSAE